VIFISGDQETGGATVAVIGPTTADNLFGTRVGCGGERHPHRWATVPCDRRFDLRGGSSFGNQDDLVYVTIEHGSDAVDSPAQLSRGHDLFIGCFFRRG